jgi:hypothetical protein
MQPITVRDDAPPLGLSYSPLKHKVESSHSDEKHNYSLHSSHIHDVPD